MADVVGVVGVVVVEVGEVVVVVVGVDVEALATTAGETSAQLPLTFCH